MGHRIRSATSLEMRDHSAANTSMMAESHSWDVVSKIRGLRKMDWRVFLTTFGVIFLAEMGDKTQLAAMTMAAQSGKPWAVFFAAAVALTAVSAIGVVAGTLLGNYLPLIWIK